MLAGSNATRRYLKILSPKSQLQSLQRTISPTSSFSLALS